MNSSDVAMPSSMLFLSTLHCLTFWIWQLLLWVCAATKEGQKIYVVMNLKLPVEVNR